MTARRPQPGRGALALAAISLLAAAVVPGGSAGGAPDGKRAKGERKRDRPPPNVVVVMTDDQTVESLRAMPKTERLLGAEGVTFTNSFAANPACCPSRATFLTGRYAHNHGVLRNTRPNGGYAGFDGDEALPVWLQRAGYFTAHVGRYLTGYGRHTDPLEIPPGWSEWHGAVDPSTYSMYGYTLNDEGALVTYGEAEVEDPADYQTDVYAAKAADLIARRAPKRRPFFLSVAPLAPHAEADPEQPDEPLGPDNPRPAPRHAGAFDDEPQPRADSFNEADVSDKPAEIRALEPLTLGEAAALADRYRARLASLLAVDDLVETVVGELGATRELNRTLIVFTSDNGYLLGEHRVRARKQYPYEESIRVPLILRGPGLPRDAERRQPVVNADLAPTILHYARAKRRPGDGRSLHRLIDDRRLEPGRAVLVENWCQVTAPGFEPETPRYLGVRTARYLYAEWASRDAELYDLDRDPLELESRHADPAYADERAALGRLLDRLADCAGRSCRARPRLDLRLDYRRGESDGRRCALSAVRARVRGADRGEALEARFRLR
ncbi:MAG: sulfatase family protein, partial [Solirubrobacterales bacterium]